MKELINQSNFNNHLFVSNTNLMTDSFSQIFTKPKNCLSNEIGELQFTPRIIWLHLTPSINVAQQINQVKEQYPDVPIVVMSNIPNDLEALASFSMLARGYCNVHAGAPVLKNIANVVMQGGIWIGESIMNKLLLTSIPLQNNKIQIESNWSAPLTSREKEVATAIAIGASNKEIAQKMSITERTVKAHVGAVLEKLHLKNRLQLALLVKDR
jgi:two-component system nitrate/nitrite response regulator NarL